VPAKNRPGERHIRAYLRYLQDPSTAVDQAAVQRAVAAVEATGDDPIGRVMALSRLEAAQAVPDGSAMEDAFIAHVVPWAEAAQVTYNALTSMGVPPDVLARAGLEPSAEPPPVRRRLPVIPLDDVYVKLPARGTFTSKEVGATWGRTAHTANAWLNALAADGRVEQLGEAPDHPGKGRPPIVWRKVAKR
jgi:hypothetical protein